MAGEVQMHERPCLKGVRMNMLEQGVNFFWTPHTYMLALTAYIHMPTHKNNPNLYCGMRFSGFFCFIHSISTIAFSDI